jgi:hypothetical protein
VIAAINWSRSNYDAAGTATFVGILFLPFPIQLITGHPPAFVVRGIAGAFHAFDSTHDPRKRRRTAVLLTPIVVCWGLFVATRIRGLFVLAATFTVLGIFQLARRR